MRADEKSVFTYSTDDSTIVLACELSDNRLRSLTLKIGGSGRVPADITPGQLQDLAQLAAQATERLKAAGVAGFARDEPAPPVTGQLG